MHDISDWQAGSVGPTPRQRFPSARVGVSFATGILPLVELPDAVEAIVIAADSNLSDYAAVEAAGHAFAEQGRR